MAEAKGQLTRITLGEEGLTGQLRCPQRIQPQPGQYLLARPLEERLTLPAALFPASLPGEELALAAPLPAAWLPGQEFRLRGPFGRGFQPPVVATRAALAPLSGQMERLRPLLALLLKRGTSIALFAPRPPADLPAEVEVLPLEELPEAPAWADYLAVDLTAAQLDELPRLFTTQSGKRLPCAAEALVLTPLACGGQAECGVCALETSRGWQLACKDGPVFDLNLFLGVK